MYTLLESPGPDLLFGLGLEKKGPKKLKRLQFFDEQLIFGDLGDHFVIIWGDR